MKLLNLSLKAILQVAVAFLLGAMVMFAIGSPQYATTAGVVMAAFCFIPKGKKFSAGILATITAADVVTEFGAYYIDQGQGVQDLLAKLMQKSVTASYFPTRVTNDTVLRKASFEFSSVLQTFQKAFTPIGGVTFEPLNVYLQKLKIDLTDTPDDLEQSWLGFLADNSLDRKQWPYIKWRLNGALMQADKDLELLEIYAGTGPTSPTAGTATTPGTNLLGIKKQINAMNTADTLTLITMGATPTDPVDFVNYVETMIEETDPVLRNEIDFIFMSQVNRNLYRDGMRIKYNTYYEQTADGQITNLRNYPIQVIGLPSMVGSTKIWFTPPWNRVAGFKKPGNEKVFQVENVDRTVKAYTDYYKCFGFWLPQYLSTNDVELT